MCRCPVGSKRQAGNDMKTRQRVKRVVSVEQAVADLNSLATELQKRRVTVAGREHPIGDSVKYKWKARVTDGKVVLDLSLRIPLQAVPDTAQSPDRSDRSVRSDEAVPEPQESKTPAELKAEVKRIKKSLALLWKATRKRVLAGEMPTAAEYAGILQAFDDFSAIADPVWTERWQECHRIAASGLDPASSDTVAAEQAIDTLNRMVRECHKRFR